MYLEGNVNLPLSNLFILFIWDTIRGPSFYFVPSPYPSQPLPIKNVGVQLTTPFRNDSSTINSFLPSQLPYSMDLYVSFL